MDFQSKPHFQFNLLAVASNLVSDGLHQGEFSFFPEKTGAKSLNELQKTERGIRGNQKGGPCLVACRVLPQIATL